MLGFSGGGPPPETCTRAIGHEQLNDGWQVTVAQ